ncbi:hypothetical protein, partial [Bradyrhizobium sp.]|uniref:hypothetical protein n=1 Tax=Bradyrhizobium sp. TaxID=376 RepID=UPI002734FD21
MVRLLGWCLMPGRNRREFGRKAAMTASVPQATLPAAGAIDVRTPNGHMPPLPRRRSIRRNDGAANQVRTTNPIRIRESGTPC